jgi:hypothetical protein
MESPSEASYVRFLIYLAFHALLLCQTSADERVL